MWKFSQQWLLGAGRIRAQKEEPGVQELLASGGGLEGHNPLRPGIFIGASVNISDVPSRGPRAAVYRRAGGGGRGRGGLQGALELQQLALQHPLFTGQGGNSPQVFPDFNKFGGVLLFLFRWFFQLVQPLLPSQQLLLKGALQPLGFQLLLLLLDELVPPTVLQDTLQLWLAVHTQAPFVVHKQLSVQLLVAPGGLHRVQQLLGLDELWVPLSVLRPSHQASDVCPLSLDL